MAEKQKRPDQPQDADRRIGRMILGADRTTMHTQPDLEKKGWEWLHRTVEATSDEDPADLAYSANQMVDAYIAGAAGARR